MNLISRQCGNKVSQINSYFPNMIHSCSQKLSKVSIGEIQTFGTDLSPLPLVMFTSFSIPPVSAKALAFSMFLLVTSCKAQQMAATVSSERMLGPLPPGRRFTKSRIAYLPEKQAMNYATVYTFNIIKNDDMEKYTYSKQWKEVLFNMGKLIS